MEIAVRPAVTAGVALAAAGMIAATPVTSVVPEVQLPEIQLAAAGEGFSADLQGWFSGFNSDLLNGLTSFNDALKGAQVGFEELISGPFKYLPLHLNDDFAPDNILNGILNRGYNVFNMGLGGGQQGFLGLLGADFQSGDITKSLLVGLNNGSNDVFDNGTIGGLQGMFGQGLQAFANLTGFPTDELMQGLEDGISGFNTQLVDGLIGFNSGMVTGQVNLEEFIFGTDSALNGVINRSFNVFNMFLDAGQQSFLGMLGADFDASALTSSLLTGSAAQVFNDGTIGGLEGVLGQSYMVLADMVGLLDPGDMFSNIDLFSMFNPLDFLINLLTSAF